MGGACALLVVAAGSSLIYGASAPGGRRPTWLRRWWRWRWRRGVALGFRVLALSSPGCCRLAGKREEQGKEWWCTSGLQSLCWVYAVHRKSNCLNSWTRWTSPATGASPSCRSGFGPALGAWTGSAARCGSCGADWNCRNGGLSASCIDILLGLARLYGP